MSAAQSAVLMLAAAVLLANLAVLAGRAPWQRLAAWAGAYAAWSVLCRLLATAGGQAAPLAWELWASSLAFFAVLGLPAIVWRYLRVARR